MLSLFVLYGVTWQDFEAGLEGNLQDLHAKVHRGTDAVGDRLGGRQNSAAGGRDSSELDLRRRFFRLLIGTRPS